MGKGSAAATQIDRNDLVPYFRGEVEGLDDVGVHILRTSPDQVKVYIKFDGAGLEFAGTSSYTEGSQPTLTKLYQADPSNWLAFSTKFGDENVIGHCKRSKSEAEQPFQFTRLSPDEAEPLFQSAEFYGTPTYDEAEYMSLLENGLYVLVITTFFDRNDPRAGNNYGVNHRVAPAPYYRIFIGKPKKMIEYPLSSSQPNLAYQCIDDFPLRSSFGTYEFPTCPTGTLNELKKKAKFTTTEGAGRTLKSKRFFMWSNITPKMIKNLGIKLRRPPTRHKADEIFCGKRGDKKPTD